MYDKILTSLSYGICAVGVKGATAPNACIVNAVIQISSYPMTVAVSINHSNYTNECIKQSGQFSVSVLSENTSGAVIGALGFNSGRDGNKLANGFVSTADFGSFNIFVVKGAYNNKTALPEGVDCNPVIKIDNIRVVPNK